MMDIFNIEPVVIIVYEYLDYKDGYHYSNVINELSRTDKYKNLSKEYRNHELKNNFKQIRNLTLHTINENLMSFDNLIRIKFTCSLTDLKKIITIPDNVSEVIFADRIDCNSIKLHDNITKIRFNCGLCCDEDGIPLHFFPSELNKLYISNIQKSKKRSKKGSKVKCDVSIVQNSISFPKTKVLELGSDFNVRLYEGIFSPFTDELILNFYNYPFDPNVLPSELKKLVLRNYNKSLSEEINTNTYEKKSKSKKKKKLDYEDDSDDQIEKKHNVYYDDDKEIKINNTSESFKKCISYLPNKLHTLVIGDKYNKPFSIGCLPPSLTSLTIGDHYNRPFEKNTLPSSLTYLKIGDDYSCGFPVLPISLKTLIIGDKYNQIFPKLPDLETLILGIRYNRSFNNVLPNTLKRLELRGQYNVEFKNSLPDSLEVLVLRDYIHVLDRDILPIQLKSINLGINYNHVITKNTFPDSLEILILSNVYNRKLEYLPPRLKEIRFGKKYNQIIEEKVLPPTLETLIFGGIYNQPIMHNVFPDSITKIVFGFKYSLKILPGVLPNNLEYLEFSSQYESMLLELPHSVKTLLIDEKHSIYVNELYNREDRTIKYYQSVCCNSCNKKTKLYISNNNLSMYKCSACLEWDAETPSYKKSSKKKEERSDIEEDDMEDTDDVDDIDNVEEADMDDEMEADV